MQSSAFNKPTSQSREPRIEVEETESPKECKQRCCQAPDREQDLVKGMTSKY